MSQEKANNITMVHTNGISSSAVTDELRARTSSPEEPLPRGTPVILQTAFTLYIPEYLRHVIPCYEETIKTFKDKTEQ